MLGANKCYSVSHNKEMHVWDYKATLMQLICDYTPRLHEFGMSSSRGIFFSAVYQLPHIGYTYT